MHQRHLDALGAILSEELKHAGELKSLSETMARNNPEHYTAEDLDGFMRRMMGCGFGEWQTKANGDRELHIKTGRDFLNMAVLKAHWMDELAAIKALIVHNKDTVRMLEFILEHKETTTPQKAIAMKDKIDSEYAEGLPVPEALMAIGDQVIAEAAKRPAQINSITEKVGQAREALFAAMADIGTTFHTFKEASDGIAKELHAFRSSVVTDLSKARSEMEDVRKFFLSKDHVVEIERLREFITLCEKLKALKDSGFLDAVADTILKLEGS